MEGSLYETKIKNKQIKKIFIKQNNIIAVISIILGLPAGFYLTDWIFKTAIEESYDFGAHINIETYVIAAIGTFLIYLAMFILICIFFTGHGTFIYEAF